jgi:hypothetical protein
MSDPNHPETVEGCQYLYRYRNAAGALLYVGRSGNPLVRFKHGHRSKDWHADIAEIELEEFATLADVMAAEVEAIQTEGPLYNVMHTASGRQRRQVRPKTPELPKVSGFKAGNLHGGFWSHTAGSWADPPNGVIAQLLGVTESTKVLRFTFGADFAFTEDTYFSPAVVDQAPALLELQTANMAALVRTIESAGYAVTGSEVSAGVIDAPPYVRLALNSNDAGGDWPVLEVVTAIRSGAGVVGVSHWFAGMGSSLSFVSKGRYPS